MGNARRIKFFIILYALSGAQLNFMRMILLINQWYHRKSESEKTLVTLFKSKKFEREAFNKEKALKYHVG